MWCFCLHASAAAALLPTVRSQLDVDESRSQEVERLLQLVLGTFEKIKKDKGGQQRDKCVRKCTAYLVAHAVFAA